MAARGEKVTKLPPLPRVPEPPRFPPDARQRRTKHILDNLAATTNQNVKANMTDGFPASAVDVGRLQEAAERALRHFTEKRLAARWDEVFDWVRRFLARWVQRRKTMKITRHGAAIRIELTTQDDLGYYKYAFDVFPQRRRE